MKALLHYNASPYLIQAMTEAAPDWLDVVAIASEDWTAFEKEISDTDIVWHVLEPFTAKLMAQAPNLKLIHKLGVGVNTIDLEAAKARGIAVANMPGSNAQAVAEHAVALMLAVLRNVVVGDDLIRRRNGWAMTASAMDGMGELCRRTVGLIGYGSVGKTIGKICAAFGANVLYTARTQKEGALARWRGLDDLVREADIVCLCLPLTPETDTLLNNERVATMKPGAILINTSRGGLVDEQALVAALQSDHLRGAGLDVFAVEPLPQASPLRDLPNVVMSPHAAWLSRETLDRTAKLAIQNAVLLERGDPLLHRVI